MSAAAAPPRFGVGALGAALLGDPIAFLAAEQARQRTLLAHLDRLARAPTARGARPMGRVLLRWLREDLPLHRADATESLYPRLQPHDRTGALARLAEAPRREAGPLAQVIEGLHRFVADGTPAPGFLAAAAGFSRRHRQHLDLEEAVAMPLARAVLDGAARAALAAEMAARRGRKDTLPCPSDA